MVVDLCYHTALVDNPKDVPYFLTLYHTLCFDSFIDNLNLNLRNELSW